MINIYLDTKQHLLNLFYLKTKEEEVNKDEMQYPEAVIMPKFVIIALNCTNAPICNKF